MLSVALVTRPAPLLSPWADRAGSGFAYGQAGSVLSWYHSRPEENEQERSMEEVAPRILIDSGHQDAISDSSLNK